LIAHLRSLVKRGNVRRMPLQGPVLVASDLSEGADEALRQGNALARSLNASLHVCHVLPELLSLDPLFPQLNLRDALAAPEMEAKAADALEEQVKDVTGREPGTFEVMLQTGAPHAGIVQAAESLVAGVVVLGAAGTGRRVGSLGGVAERVVRNAHCAVLVARPSPPGAVLGATDFSDPALPAVEAAVAEARRRGVPLALIYSMDLLPPGVVGYEVPPLSAEVIAAMRAQSEERLKEALARLGAEGTLTIAEGPAGPTIVKTAASLPAELVVVGTHGRTGLRRFVLGSVAEAVVRSAPCSALVVRLGHRA
jgi:nucleotide-binding universal stress UspA family protein